MKSFSSSEWSLMNLLSSFTATPQRYASGSNGSGGLLVPTGSSAALACGDVFRLRLVADPLFGTSSHSDAGTIFGGGKGCPDARAAAAAKGSPFRSTSNGSENGL